MGFLRGVITGVAVAGAAAAWYMSRSGQQIREQYRIEHRLGELGDQIEARTREIQNQVNAQLAERRAQGQDLADGVLSTNGHDATETLDAASASAAEAAADLTAEADAITAKIKSTTKDVAGNGAN